MNELFYTRHQLRVFAEDLPKVFLDAGFEMIEEPYIDYGLCGFRATYIRRYLLHQPLPFKEGILTTVVHTVGLPFGHRGQKMVVLAAARDLSNEPVCETMKLRLSFDADGTPNVVLNDQQEPEQQRDSSPSSSRYAGESAVGQELDRLQQQQTINHFLGFRCGSRRPSKLYCDLAKFVAHIIEAISPGLIQLPIEMKLEILKKLSVESIIKMSQVNSEFRQLIFKHGEALWRHLCHRDFGIQVINRLIHNSWMNLYRDTYLLHQLEICRKERALPGLPERLALPPAPYRQPIGWLPEVLELPFYPIEGEAIALPGNPIHLALEFRPLRRADSLDSLHRELMDA